MIGFVGDAGFYYHMAELETAARYGINAVMVVNTNYSGGVLEKVAYERSVNFAKVAESMGCVGIRVEKPADIRSALDKALACGKPAVVDSRERRHDPREARLGAAYDQRRVSRVASDE